LFDVIRSFHILVLNYIKYDFDILFQTDDDTILLR